MMSPLGNVDDCLGPMDARTGERVWKGLEAIATMLKIILFEFDSIEFDIQLDLGLINGILDFLIFPNLRRIGSPIEFHHF